VIYRAILGLGIVVGGLFLWVGVPLLGFWLAGDLTTTGKGFLLAALGGIPLAMVCFGFLLYRLNDLYESAGGQRAGAPRSAWLVSATDEPRRVRGARRPRTLIEVTMTFSIVVALALLFVWFFFLGETRLAPLP
jgi:hypothetical protein